MISWLLLLAPPQPAATPEPEPAQDAVPDPEPAPAAPKPAAPDPAPAPVPEPSTAKKPIPSSEAIARQSDVNLGRKGKKDKWNRPGSPQRFELEFKIGPYLPNVDRRYGGPGLGPYATIFGRTDGTGMATRKPRQGVMPVLGFEWQFAYLAGPFLLGTQIGFFRDKADALLTNPEPGENLRSSADNVVFGMVPISLLGGYRFSLLADRFKVPLVPYAKGGMVYGFWWTKNGGKISENSQGEKGRGGVWGWQLNAGGMLRLDFLEPTSAKKLDQATGINHTYLFGEYQLTRMANFGIGNSIAIGDSTWFVGLAIEF